MEDTVTKIAKILGIVGWCFLIGAILFALQVGFMASMLSLALWIHSYGGDIELIIFSVKAHSFLIQFALVMFVFSGLFWLISKWRKRK